MTYRQHRLLVGAAVPVIAPSFAISQGAWGNVHDLGTGDSRNERVEAYKVINNPTYFKWTVVRHPWDRVVSAYRSKYEGHCNRSTECMESQFGVPSWGASNYSFHGNLPSLCLSCALCRMYYQRFYIMQAFV